MTLKSLFFGHKLIAAAVAAGLLVAGGSALLLTQDSGTGAGDARLNVPSGQLAYIKGNFGNGALWVYDPATSESSQLTSIDTYRLVHSWSPDNTQILVSGEDPSEAGDGDATSWLAVVNVGSGELKKIPGVPSFTFPKPSQPVWVDNDTIRYVHERAVYDATLDGITTPIHQIQDESGCFLTYAANKDMSWLAYQRNCSFTTRQEPTILVNTLASTEEALASVDGLPLEIDGGKLAYSAVKFTGETRTEPDGSKQYDESGEFVYKVYEPAGIGVYDIESGRTSKLISEDSDGELSSFDLSADRYLVGRTVDGDEDSFIGSRQYDYGNFYLGQDGKEKLIYRSSPGEGASSAGFSNNGNLAVYSVFPSRDYAARNDGYEFEQKMYLIDLGTQESIDLCGAESCRWFTWQN